MPHPDGSVDPLRDVETIETELLLADYEQTERRLERVTKQARSGDPVEIAERDWLECGPRGARRRPAWPDRSRSPQSAPESERLLGALTSKPVLYVANVDEGDDEIPAALAEHAAQAGSGRGRGQRPDRGRAG